MENIEKIFVIQPVHGANYRVLHDEAKSLIESAGAEYCGSCYQNVKEINPATYIGAGKLEEIRQNLDGVEGVTVLFNGALSPSQTLNISAAVGGRKVIDRTTLILDIFARNAVSSEGKVQVELAQLKYIYPRLKGKGSALSRLGGGIGSRGPGETQLETDRRHIRTRIKYLEKKLSEMNGRRTLQSELRTKRNTKTIALVGYTNTGKSTLMNALTNAGVMEKDALFATLDPTARQFFIDGAEFLLFDTVGFIQELPHDIVEAFKSTLEVAVNCDLALLVASADGDYEMQFRVTESTLAELGFDKPFIKVINKCDEAEDLSSFPSVCVLISAKFRRGLDTLTAKIRDSFKDKIVNLKLSVKYADFDKYSAVAKYAKENSRNFTDDGMELEITVNAEYAYKFSEFVS